MPHVPQTIARLTRTPLHLTPLVPLGVDMHVRPISSIIKRPNPHLIRTRLRQIKLSIPDLLELIVAGVGPHLLNLLLRVLRTLIRIRKKITILVIPIRVRLTPRRHPTLIQTPILRKPRPRLPVIPHHPATITIPLHQTQRTTIPMIHRLPIPIPRPVVQRPLHILLGVLVTGFLLPLLRRNRLAHRSIRVIRPPCRTRSHTSSCTWLLKFLLRKRIQGIRIGFPTTGTATSLTRRRPITRPM